MKVLWIDDDRLYVKPLAEDLEDYGCEVTRVWNVEDGYDAILSDAGSYDAILIDVMMSAQGRFAVEEARGGKRTGIVLLGYIHDHDPELLKKVKVVTVVSDPEVKEFAESLGADFHLKSLTSAEKILGIEIESE